MKAKSPPDRRKFANAWDEINYLYDKLLFWLYQRQTAYKARPYADRIEQLLLQATPDHDAIFGEECWSLVHETKGDLHEAIDHRKNEIRLIRQLHDISRNAPHENLVHKDYGYDALNDRLGLLAVLYHDNGNLDKALSTLQESKKLCEKHGIKFDGEDMMKEYWEEKRNSTLRDSGRKRRQPAIRASGPM